MESLLINFSEVHRILSYSVIFFGMFIEGEVILILAGVLIRAGNLDFFDTLFLAFGAVVIHDIVYWFVGKKLAGREKKKFLFFNLGKLEPVLEKIKRNNNVYIFVSKFAWSLNRFILIASGYSGMPLKKLLCSAVPTALIWTTTFVSFGFIFAYKTELLKQNLKTAIVLLTVFLLAVIVLENLLQKIFNNSKNKDA